MLEKSKKYFKEMLERNPKVRKTIGVFFIIIGIIGIITPFTPFGFLLFVGLGILGVNFLFVEKIKKWFKSKK